MGHKLINSKNVILAKLLLPNSSVKLGTRRKLILEETFFYIQFVLS